MFIFLERYPRIAGGVKLPFDAVPVVVELGAGETPANTTLHGSHASSEKRSVAADSTENERIRLKKRQLPFAHFPLKTAKAAIIDSVYHLPLVPLDELPRR